MAGIRVLIADDQALVRGGFRLILEAQPDIEVVGEAIDGVEAVELARRLRPDVVLMDVRMPGWTASRPPAWPAWPGDLGRHPGADLDHLRPRRVRLSAMRAGASGFLLKTVPPRPGRRRPRHRRRRRPVGLDITRRLIEQFVHRPHPAAGPPRSIAKLTPRELEVLRLVARGLSNAEIASHLVGARLPCAPTWPDPGQAQGP